MADAMIDLETLATGNDACILTIALQTFDPLGRGYYDKHYYCRVDPESQPDREIDDSTIEWWAKQPEASKEEALGIDNRIPLKQALEELYPYIWNANLIWAQGPTFDMNILEDAYKSYGMQLPWKFYKVRDSRTVFSLYPELSKAPVSHHALEDCRGQIASLQETLRYLEVTKLK